MLADAMLLSLLREQAIPLGDTPAAYQPLIDLVGDAKVVCIGEATHGTHDFYQARAEVTRLLIEQKGFTAVCAEADWPDAHRVNRYVRHLSDEGPEESLRDFQRFPTWMWRNHEVLDFITWLRQHNDGLSPGQHRTGFYGLDLYSLYRSIQAVLQYLDEHDPAAALRARQRYSCFDHLGDDPQAYGYASAYGQTESCEQPVLDQLTEMLIQSGEHAAQVPDLDPDERFVAEQNARLVRNAEEYYRAMFHGERSTWNLRDRHMVQTLVALLEHLERRQPDARAVVWAHNSHVGDARATEMGRAGEWNVGQLTREHFGDRARLIGFTTHRGTVVAAHQWDGPAYQRVVRPGLPGSYEALFRDVGIDRFLLRFRDHAALASELPDLLLERAIGVIYRPETERYSHYFGCRIADQFDAVLHFDVTRALESLDPVEQQEPGEVPDWLSSAA